MTLYQSSLTLQLPSSIQPYHRSFCFDTYVSINGKINRLLNCLENEIKLTFEHSAQTSTQFNPSFILDYGQITYVLVDTPFCYKQHKLFIQIFVVYIYQEEKQDLTVHMHQSRLAGWATISNSASICKWEDKRSISANVSCCSCNGCQWVRLGSWVEFIFVEFIFIDNKNLGFGMDTEKKTCLQIYKSSSSLPSRLIVCFTLTVVQSKRTISFNFSLRQ